MPFSDEDIIAFLLGEADSSLAIRIQECMQNDSRLVDRVSHFRSLLNHLNGTGQCFEPPSGLIEATLRRMGDVEADAMREPRGAFSDNAENPANAATLPDGSTNLAVAGFKPQSGGLLSLFREWGQNNQLQSAFDSMALSIGLVCLSCVILPAILRVRFESRRAQCAENLRLNGQALFCFALRSADQRLPAVPSAGPEAFAGIYSVRLVNAGLMNSASQLRCVSLAGIERPMVTDISRFPTLFEIRQATQQQLAIWKQHLGGDYAYNLGIFDKLGVVAPKNTGSSHFAILADSPTTISGEETWSAHDGKGSNILYDDGHVAFITHSQLDSIGIVGDHPFWNRHGFREAGLDNTDASLAPSPCPPLDR